MGVVEAERPLVRERIAVGVTFERARAGQLGANFDLGVLVRFGGNDCHALNVSVALISRPIAFNAYERLVGLINYLFPSAGSI